MRTLPSANQNHHSMNPNQYFDDFAGAYECAPALVREQHTRLKRHGCAFTAQLLCVRVSLPHSLLLANPSHADCGDLNVPSADMGTELRWADMFTDWFRA